MGKILIGIILLVVLVGGGWYLYQQSLTPTSVTPVVENVATTAPTPVLDPTPVASVSAALNMDVVEAQAFSSSKYGFTIHPPKGWIANENLGQSIVVSFSDAVQTGINAGASINIVTPQNTDGSTLDSMIEDIKKALPNILTNYNVVEERNVTVNGYEGRVIGGTFVQGTANLRNRQLILVNKDLVYVITGTGLLANWDKNQNIIEASMMSFDLK